MREPFREPKRNDGGHILPILVEALEERSAGSAGWYIDGDAASPGVWVAVRQASSQLPEQGWKLHLAASVGSAEAVLRKALPVLFEEGADFKVVASLRRLGEINDSGSSQVGKFITVYPRDDAQAVQLARALDEATRGLRAVAIPSDRPLRPRSIVHYRYGGFRSRPVRTPVGEILPSIVTPEGHLVADRRLSSYYAPSWARDPFVDAGVADELPIPTQRIGTRYVLLASLHRSPRSATYLCFDVDTPRRCVIKKVLEDGCGNTDRLRHEADVLSRLAPHPQFPAPFELFSDEDACFLAMEDLEGETFERIVSSHRERNTLPTHQEVVTWGSELASALSVVHRNGFVYGDLNASNVLVATDGHVRLFDFELAVERDHQHTESAGTRGVGTIGYLSPQRAAGHRQEIADDIYGFGAILFLLSTGAEPSQAPTPSSLLDRRIELLNPAVSPALADAIERCLDPVPTHRFASAADVHAALTFAATVTPPSGTSFGSACSTEDESSGRRLSSHLARRLGDRICEAARRSTDDSFLGWASEHPFAEVYSSTDLNAGGGAVLALAELVSVFDDACHREMLIEGARWLAEAPRPLGPPLCGLYVGEAGAGVAQLRAGQVLGDSALIAAAAARGSWIARLPYSSPDLFVGTAGLLRFHLWLWEATGSHLHLDDAIAAGQQLLTDAEQNSDGEVKWTIPAGYESLSNRAWLGYAHGAAGIGDVLLDLFDVTHDERFLVAAQGAGRWLKRLARPVLDDGSGLNWPVTEDSPSMMTFWCHGAAGIGRFMLHLHQLDAMPSAWEFAERAARAVARGARWAGATQCHGLAGNIELLLDMYQACGDAGYLCEARALACLLNTFARDVDGVLHWVTDSDVSNPGFTAGYAGVATCLLRLAHPETQPHPLSAARFRKASGRAGGWAPSSSETGKRPPRTWRV